MVGTKTQAQDAIREEAERCGAFYVNARWLGGMLTNFQTIKLSIERLRKLDEMLEDPQLLNALTKREMQGLRRERDKLLSSLGGIKNMRKLPDMIFVIDPSKEEIAVKEANKLGVPVVAVVDTNCDPDLVDFKIPGNDDAIRAIRLFCAAIAEAVIDGRNVYEERQRGGQGEAFDTKPSIDVSGPMDGMVPSDDAAASEASVPEVSGEGGDGSEVPQP
jgi:small subunit ribosomal protein S2